MSHPFEGDTDVEKLSPSEVFEMHFHAVKTMFLDILKREPTQEELQSIFAMFGDMKKNPSSQSRPEKDWFDLVQTRLYAMRNAIDTERFWRKKPTHPTAVFRYRIDRTLRWLRGEQPEDTLSNESENG